jgi:DNA-binding CsgD family transcriptional regulator
MNDMTCTAGAAKVRRLPPRALQTLTGLLEGLSEKQLAGRLAISKHTVHSYVTRLYSIYEVNSRCELLALWIAGNPGTHPALRPRGAAHVVHVSIDVLKAERGRLAAEVGRLDQEIAAKEEQLLRLRTTGAGVNGYAAAR